MANLIIVYRVLVFVSVVTLIHMRHQQFLNMAAIDSVDLSTLMPHVLEVLPTAARIVPAEQGVDQVPNGGEQIVDANDHLLGHVIRTSPSADHIVGFSGPTDLVLIFDDQDQALSVKVLSSRDTRDHVQKILDDPIFLNSLTGRSEDEFRAGARVDAVSGATLTCFAMLEAIRYRLNQIAESATDDAGSKTEMGDNKWTSFRFPNPPRMKDVQLIFPNAVSVAAQPDTTGLWHVLDSAGSRTGSILRTAPFGDGIVGYQGPTDTLAGLSAEPEAHRQMTVVGIAIGMSYENEPYVDYVREDTYFRNLFRNRTLDQLAQLDPSAERIEGVSGATMTSLAVTEALIAAAQAQVNLIEKQRKMADLPPQMTLTQQLVTARNLSTAGLALLGVLIGVTRLRGRRWLRLAYQVTLIVWLGLINGDMVSQALLLGWSQSGIPWRSASGLIVLTFAAVLVPVVSGHNIYCSHICPHGVVQQLIRNRLPWRPLLSARIQKLLKYVPWLLNVWVLAIGMLHLPFSPVDIEPFDAWLWTIAGTATILVAALGLTASAFIPMSYCRFGCPTGAVLDFLVRPRKSRWQGRDTAALGLLVIAVILFVI